MEQQKLAESADKQQIKQSWKRLGKGARIYQICIHCLALFGLAVIAAWACYKLGLANNAGSVDKNNRYLADYKNAEVKPDSADYFSASMEYLLKLVALSRSYPENAYLIYEANRGNDSPEIAERMVYAAEMYLQDDTTGAVYRKMSSELKSVLDKYPSDQRRTNLIPWMNDPG